MSATVESFRTAVAEARIPEIHRLVLADPSLPMTDAGDGMSVLLHAHYDNRHEVVAALLSGQPSIGVFEAASLGRLPRLRQLLAGDAALARAYAPDGFTPLHVAAHFCHPAAVAALLEHGADPAAVTRNDGRVTPLHSGVAARRGEPEEVLAVVRTLLAHGAPVNAQQAGGYTVLHTAARRGDVDLVALLRSHGADPALADDKGHTARDHAAKRGQQRVMDLLTPTAAG